MLRLTVAPLPPEEFGGDIDPGGSSPILEFAAEHIGDAESITFEVAYVGYEESPDVLTVNRAGEVTHVG